MGSGRGPTGPSSSGCEDSRFPSLDWGRRHRHQTCRPDWRPSSPHEFIGIARASSLPSRLHTRCSDNFVEGQKVLSEPGRFDAPASRDPPADSVVDEAMARVNPSRYRRSPQTRWIAAMNLILHRHFPVCVGTGQNRMKSLALLGVRCFWQATEYCCWGGSVPANLYGARRDGQGRPRDIRGGLACA